VSDKPNIIITYTVASTENKDLIQMRRYYPVIFNMVNTWQAKTIDMQYGKCRVLAWQRIIIYNKESMISY